MSSPRHRLLVIGCGSIGERHVRTFLATGRAAVVACDNRPAIREQIAQRYGVTCTADWEAALADPGLTGVVIAKRNRGFNSAFTVRKVSHGEGVERVFQTFSPTIHSVVVKRRGDVGKAKLYHLRELEGKAARIKEKL